MPDFVEASQEYENDVTFVFFDSFDGTRETVERLKLLQKSILNESSIIGPGYISYLFQTNSCQLLLINKEGSSLFISRYDI